MTSFGGIGGLSRSSTAEAMLAKKFRDLERRIRELETAQPFAMASGNFDGTLNPPAAGTMGWGITAAGAAIFNTLTLRSGAIPNNALAAASLPTVGFQPASGYSIPSGTGTVRATVTLPIPSGYSQLFFIAAVQDYAHNNSGSSDWLNSVLVITPPVGSVVFANGSSPDCLSANTASQAWIAQQFTGLTTGSVTFASRPATSTATWGANAVNATAVSVLGLFVR